jgi:16S rRNA (cytidine1402-2'-O)-methyltransferase
MVTAGTLYIVATPLGNLGDLTARASALLREIGIVAAEDTRRTRQLLHHLGGHARVLSYHAHSGPRRAETLVAMLEQGRDVALVSDAGTPGVSDPGAELVARVRAAGIAVVPIPGPSAVGAALSAAGFPADRFLFLGFLPRKGAERRRLVSVAAGSEWPVVLFEAPGRLGSLLEDLRQAAGDDREAVVARELTKVHEEIVAGSLGTLVSRWSGKPPKGEVTVVLSESPSRPRSPDQEGGALETRAREFLEAGGSRRDAVRRLMEESGMPRNAAYRVVAGLE